MSSSSKLKTSERQAILTKVQVILKKKYGRKLPTSNRPVLESLLFAACLEDSSDDAAEEAYARLMGAFHDLNEIRVSTISEIERELASLSHAEWRALRIRDVLQTVFEGSFQFDLEHLKRKTQEAALKELNRFRHISPFMKLHVIQHSLGSHVLALDETMLAALIWLGQIDPESSIEQASEELKPAIRKSDAAAFCHHLRAWVNDPPFRNTFKMLKKETEQGIDPETSIARLEEVIKSGGKRLAPPAKSVAKPATKSPAKSSASDKPGTKSPAKSASSGAASKGASSSKTAVKKKPVPATKSRPAKSVPAASKTAPKKTVKKKVATPAKPAKKPTKKK